MSFRRRLKRFRNAFGIGLPAHSFANRSVRDQIEEVILLTLVSILGIGLMFTLWQKVQLNQQMLEVLKQETTFLQQQAEPQHR